MKWNWQQADWPNFTYAENKLKKFESQFLHESGILLGTFSHVHGNEKLELSVELISNEALKTSEIEGEYLNRDSVQSSIRRHFGLETDNRRIAPAEQGIAELMVDLYHSFQLPLTHEHLFAWHNMLMQGRQDLTDIGQYRTDNQPMQVVSGTIYAPKVHFEAPPSHLMPKEMEQFLRWFNSTAPRSSDELPALTRAGIAHLYFVSIHPFEDGNGRIGRAIAEKALSQSLGQPTLISLAHTIERSRKRYYDALAQANKNNELTTWLSYFGQTILEAQQYTLTRFDFLIKKTKLYDKIRQQLNERQDKALARMFREGPEGFTGGMSAENYISITKTSRATATRDLHDLVQKGALLQTGQLRYTRYHLNL